MIDWYYMYSQRYGIFHFYLQDKIPRDVFTPRAIFINQSVFDEHLYKHEGEHFMSRVNVRIVNIINIIKERIETNNTEPFLFTDCDILIGPIVSQAIPIYAQHETIDMWFQKEFTEPENKTINPGCILIRPTMKTLIFWVRVLDYMNTRHITDMEAPNKILGEGVDFPWQFFDLNHVNTSITIRNWDYAIYHVLCSCINRQQDMVNKYLEAAHMHQPLDHYESKVLEAFGSVYW